MLTVISPAKALDLSPVTTSTTRPAWQDDATYLAGLMQKKSVDEIRKMMDLSEDLAQLNRDRFLAFASAPTPDVEKPAIFTFNGDTYQGFDAPTLDAQALSYAQGHLRILSGLYGMLRPLDAIQPYRLEMGRRLQTSRGTTLYAYWGDRIARALNDQAEEMGTEFLIDCASQEYFKVIDRKALQLMVITPTFLEIKNNVGKTVSFYAKRARGAMARFVVENRITDPADLRAFNVGGYKWDPASQPGKPVFTRPSPTA
ncbi:yaaA [Ketogulonicigenium robustum]|uniref:UPF0246 protein BVG79_02454 n=1 Tax=Ketogulonicigenium robustum TaxID=92947 RepID=A0A1W6P2X2_9RHOB|nr:peroxide stress protein YaaA [Ketogulonicigenium robustum]ARO15794.1 yaaA [Ketogulonicigenium robustum]